MGSGVDRTPASSVQAGPHVLALRLEALIVADRSGVYSLAVLKVISGPGAARAVSSLVRAWGPFGATTLDTRIRCQVGSRSLADRAQLVRSRAGSRDHGTVEWVGGGVRSHL